MSSPEKPYRTRHPLPTAHEREILTILMEECAEVIVNCSKALRFGLNDGYPGSGVTNRKAIGLEMGDIEAVLDLAHRAGIISAKDINEGRSEKVDRLRQFMQTKLGDQ